MARSSNVAALRKALKKVYGKDAYKHMIIFADKRKNDYRVKVLCYTERQDEVVKEMAPVPVTYKTGRNDYPHSYRYTAFFVPFGEEGDA